MSTAPTGWQNPKTTWQAADAPLPADFNRIEGNAVAVETGAREIDPAQTPSGNTGSLRQLLDWFANRLKAITGATNWWDSPTKTLADLQAEKVAKAGDTMSGALQFTDANKFLKLLSPSVFGLGADMTMVVESKNYVNLCANAYFDGSAWQRYNTAANSFRLVLNYVSCTLDVYTAVAGANPIAWSGPLKVFHEGEPVPLTGIAVAAKTSAGGTEANRLAVTDASGRVGAAKDAQTLNGASAGEIRGFRLIRSLGTTPKSNSVTSGHQFCVTATHIFYIDTGGAFKKCDIGSGSETVLASPPAALTVELIPTGSDRITLLGYDSASPYHAKAWHYTISSNQWSSAIDLQNGQDNYAQQDRICGFWDGNNYLYVGMTWRSGSSTYYGHVKRLTLSTSAVTQLWQSSSSSSYTGVCGVAVFSSQLYWGYYVSTTGYLMKSNLDGSGATTLAADTYSPIYPMVAGCLSPARIAMGLYRRFPFVVNVESQTSNTVVVSDSYNGIFYGGHLYRFVSGTAGPSGISKLTDPLA